MHQRYLDAHLKLFSNFFLQDGHFHFACIEVNHSGIVLDSLIINQNLAQHDYPQDRVKKFDGLSCLELVFLRKKY